MRFWTGFYKSAGLRKEVSTVALIRDGKMLMGKRRDSNKWTNPGGHLDPGESADDGAVREVKEESGIDIDKSKLKHLKTESVTTPKGDKYIIHAYSYDVKGDVTSSMKEDPDAEVHRWHWVSIKDGLSKEIMDNLHSPKNVLLKAMGLQGQEKEATSQALYSRALRSYFKKQLVRHSDLPVRQAAGRASFDVYRRFARQADKRMNTLSAAGFKSDASLKNVSKRKTGMHNLEMFTKQLRAKPKAVKSLREGRSLLSIDDSV